MATASSSSEKQYSIVAIALMTSAAVISLRGLPMMAKEEMTMFFYIGFATFLFLIPAALVAAELGSAFSDHGGGVYTWVEQAYGPRAGFVAIWLQWIQNVVWYPTVMSFAAAGVAYMLARPDLANDQYYIGVFCIIFYWLSTWMTFQGSAVISKVTGGSFLIGTVLPGIVVIILALLWIEYGDPVAFEHLITQDTGLVKEEAGKVLPRFWPEITSFGNIAFLAGIILLFAGVEVHAVHANEMKNPKKEFPIAMLVASLIIFLLFTLGSLAVAAVIPPNDIDLQSGLMAASQDMLDKLGLGEWNRLFCLLLAFGALGGVMSWISGPSKGLLWTATNGELPPALAKTNAEGIPTNILLLQGGIVTVLSCIYFVFKNVSVAFFLISAMTIALYLMMYMLMYASAIRLKFTQPELERPYKVPGGIGGMIVIAGLGFLGVLFAFIVSFFPPSNLPIGSPSTYVGIVIAGTVVFPSIAFIIHMMKKPSWKSSQN
ncbi:amino acid permease [Endozoicomonas ascidiicola]|uniref:amino acid permease n=1 Tax=Endozoicomonas ascidiicola TaxID=1698521 RepID=UPI000836F3A5|nr:amino acid permease [Endozoicomonas ascidiicola]